MFSALRYRVNTKKIFKVVKGQYFSTLKTTKSNNSTLCNIGKIFHQLHGKMLKKARHRECYELVNKTLMTRNQFLPLQDSYSGKERVFQRYIICGVTLRG